MDGIFLAKKIIVSRRSKGSCDLLPLLKERASCLTEAFASPQA
jgi:hypothetical protein